MSKPRGIPTPRKAPWQLAAEALEMAGAKFERRGVWFRVVRAPCRVRRTGFGPLETGAFATWLSTQGIDAGAFAVRKAAMFLASPG